MGGIVRAVCVPITAGEPKNRNRGLQPGALSLSNKVVQDPSAECQQIGPPYEEDETPHSKGNYKEALIYQYDVSFPVCTPMCLY